jgi:RimJ/RimL family protein N-acetyltransferase
MDRMAAIPEIRTARLLLRGWRQADREPFAAMNADPAVAAMLGQALDRAASDALADRIEAHWAREGFGLWAVDRLDEGRFIGFTGLARPRFEAHFTPAVEVGWRLAHAAWGQGFATEAGRAALEFGFETVGLQEIVSFTAVANERSRAVMERLGMSHDAGGDFDHPRLEPGHTHRRHVLYRLRRADWAAARRAGPG